MEGNQGIALTWGKFTLGPLGDGDDDDEDAGDGSCRDLHSSVEGAAAGELAW